MKKGEINYLTALIVIISVMSIILFGFYIYYNEEINLLDIIIPDFNESEGEVGSLEFVRYQIVENEIQYYTGESWVEISKGGVVLGDKKIDPGLFEEDVLERYFGDRGEGVVSNVGAVLDDPRLNEGNLIEDLFSYNVGRLNGARISFVEVSRRSESLGEVILKLETNIYSESGGLRNCGFIYYTPKGDLFFRGSTKFGEDSSRVFSCSAELKDFGDRVLLGVESIGKTNYDLIVDFARKERDSIFEDSLEVRYRDAASGDIVRGKRYCFEVRDDGFFTNLGENVDGIDCQ